MGYFSGINVSGLLDRLRVYELLTIVSLVWFLVQFLRYVFPPLFPAFQQEFGVSHTQTGLLFTLMMLGYSAVQFPSGWMADRTNEPIVIAGGAFVFAVATICILFVPNFLLLIVAAVFIGIGTGTHKTAAIPYISRFYPDRTGFSLGIMDTIGQLGGTLAPIVVVGLLAIGFSWRSVFAISGLVSIFIIVAFVARTLHPQFRPTEPNVKPGYDTPGADSATDRAPSYRSVFADWRVILFVAVTMVFTFAWNGFSAFFPLFLTEQKGLSTNVSGLLYSLLFGMSIVQTVTGLASDRFRRLDISLVLFMLIFICLICVIFLDGIVTILLVTALIGVGFHGFRPVRDSYLVKLLPDEVGSGSLGIVRTGMTSVGALSPAVIGYISDIAGFSLAFGVLGVVMAIGAVLLLILRRSRHKIG